MEDLVLQQWLAEVAENPPRGACWNHCRLEWDEHVEQLGERERGRESESESERKDATINHNREGEQERGRKGESERKDATIKSN